MYTTELLTEVAITSMNLLPADACTPGSTPEPSERNQVNKILAISRAGLILLQQTAL